MVLDGAAVVCDVMKCKLKNLLEMRALNEKLCEEIELSLIAYNLENVSIPTLSDYEDIDLSFENLDRALKREQSVYQACVMLNLEVKARIQEIESQNEEELKAKQLNELSRLTAAAIHVANVWTRPFR